MVKNIKVNMEVMESMLYYWDATSDREKVGEAFIMTIADAPAMKLAYDEEFDAEAVRRALSAISNREIFKGESKKESRFWNNNMWMLEDLDYMRMMIQPLKVLNLDSMIDKLNELDRKKDYETLEVVVLPLHLDTHYIVDNKLILNFFRVKPDLYVEDKITVDDQDLYEFFEEKLSEIVGC